MKIAGSGENTRSLSPLTVTLVGYFLLLRAYVATITFRLAARAAACRYLRGTIVNRPKYCQ